MSWYTVEGPREHSMRIPQKLGILGGGLLLMIVSYSAFTSVPVKVDGHWRRLRSGQTLQQVVERDLISSEPGDMLSAGDREVLKRGAGQPAALYVNGRAARMDQRVYSMDEVTSAPGADVLEPLEVMHQPIPAPMIVRGSGPVLKVLNEGSDGMKRISKGKLSGQIADETTVTAPVAARYRRSVLKNNRKVVALTFDDGPWPSSTGAVLDVLKEEQVKATFFVIGRQIGKRPWLLRRMEREGHVIGNHTWSHKPLSKLSKPMARSQILKTQTAIRKATGGDAAVLRPPGGQTDRGVYAECKRQGLEVVMWTIDPQDWRGKNRYAIRKGVVDKVKPGSIVLLHDGGGDRRETVKALRPIIQALKKKGYVFVTLDGMRSDKAKTKN